MQIDYPETNELPVVDGTMANPAYSFSSEPSSGLYRAGNGDVRLSILGADLVRYQSGILTVSGQLINSQNGALSAPGVSVTGSWITGGTATTTKPHVLIEPAGATTNNWPTTGTGLGINAASGHAGDLINAQLNGVGRFSVHSSGYMLLFAPAGTGVTTVFASPVSSESGISLAYGGATDRILQLTGNSITVLTRSTSAVANISIQPSGGGILMQGPTTFSAAVTNSRNSAINSPSNTMTGTWFTGGSSTSTKPHMLIEPTGATSTAWNIAGTGLGINAASGSTGMLIDAQLNGVSKFSANYLGDVSIGNDLLLALTGGLKMASRWRIVSGGADGKMMIANNAGSDFSMLNLGGNTSSFPAIKRNGTGIDIRLADDSGYTALTVGSLVSAGSVLAGAALNLGWTGLSRMNSPSDGVITIQNNAGTDFSRLQFGGTTSSFPSLKRNGTNIDARLADDSGTAGLVASNFAFGNIATVTYAATTDIVFGTTLRSVSLTGDITFTTSSKATGRSVIFRIIADGSTRTLTFPAGWVWTTAIPANIAANKKGYLRLMCWGSNDSDIEARWNVEA